MPPLAERESLAADRGRLAVENARLFARKYHGVARKPDYALDERSTAVARFGSIRSPSASGFARSLFSATAAVTRPVGGAADLIRTRPDLREAEARIAGSRASAPKWPSRFAKWCRSAPAVPKPQSTATRSIDSRRQRERSGPARILRAGGHDGQVLRDSRTVPALAGEVVHRVVGAVRVGVRQDEDLDVVEELLRLARTGGSPDGED